MYDKKNARFFILATYIGFYILLGVCGLVMALGLPKEVIQKAAVPIGSWLSFFILMIWSKKMYPEKTRSAFIKDLFRDKVEMKWILFSVLLPTAIFCIVSVVLNIVMKKSFSELINTDLSVYPILFFTNLIAGPTGEEPGWRGYYLMNSAKRNGLLKGTVITGVLWGLWHTPLWLMEGYTPVKLLAYAVFFMITTVSINVIFSCVYTEHRNLIYCVIMHQLFNFLTGILNLDQDGFIIYILLCSICYCITASIMIINNKTRLIGGECDIDNKRLIKILHN